MFIHHNIEPLNIRAVNGPNGRTYVTPEGKRYPSITTLLGAKEKPHLEAWRNSLGEANARKETQRCADRGTAVHTMLENLLNNHPNPTLIKGVPALIEHIGEFNTIKRYVVKHVNNIRAQEIALYSDELRVAGRVDCIAEWDGVLSVIDFKTSTNDKQPNWIDDYFMQATAYALMFHELYDVQIDQIVIAVTVEKGLVPQIFKRNIDEWIQPLVERINTYHKVRGA